MMLEAPEALDLLIGRLVPDPARRERLFQPFSAHPPQADLRGGSGLGLAICHEIVQSLGGTLELNNRVAAGRATGLDAVVRLPLAA